MRPNIGFQVDLEDIQSNFFDRVMSAVEAMQRKNIEILCAQIRKTAQNSMKQVAKLSAKKRGLLGGLGGVFYSQPGQPPLERKGLLKRFLFYTWSERDQSGYVGPVKLNIKGIASRSLELGEPTLIETGYGVNRHLATVPMQARPYMGPAMRKIMQPENLRRVYEKSLRARGGF